MKLFVVPNREKKLSKYDGKLYKYWTKYGKVVAFEEGTRFWELFSDRAVRKPFWIRNFYKEI